MNSYPVSNHQSLAGDKCWLAVLLALPFWLCATPSSLAAESELRVSDYFEFRDSYRNSADSEAIEFRNTPWKASDIELVDSRLASILEAGQGLIKRAASDGSISLYRLNVDNLFQAKGGYRRLAINSNAFPYPGYDWLTRILAHELTHSADPYDRLSANQEWKALLEPRIHVATKILDKQGLTPVKAAAMPLGDRRSRIETDIRREAGLPSAYTAFSSEEATAEIASFMLDTNSDYVPPADIATFMRSNLLAVAPSSADPAATAYRQGMTLLVEGKDVDAIGAFSEAIKVDPNFALAFMRRGIARKNQGQQSEAIDDFSQALALFSQHSRWVSRIMTERNELMRATKKRKRR